MATNAGKSFARCAHLVDVMHDILMTFPASVLRHPLAAGLHPNGLVKTVRRERERMKKTVIRFCKIFSEEVGRRVAIVASGNGAMAGFDPTIKMVLHDVTIGARLRIVAQ